MLALALLGLLGLPLARAFSFTLSSSPAQCSNLTLNWSGGTAPYEITLLPLGNLSPEIRTLVDTNTSSTSWSEQLLFPQGSTFIIVLSDATGYGTGGTSLVQTVGGGDGSCLPTTPSTSPFLFSMQPLVPAQCGSLSFSWGSGTQGQVVISAVIPGGESFTIPVTSGGGSQDWTADVSAGTAIAFIVGDATGRGKGGSSDLMTVGGGGSGCLTGSYPSSTQAPAAGAVSTGGASSSSASSSASSSSTSSSPPSSSTSSSSSSSTSSSAAGTSGSGGSGSTLPPGSGGGTVTGSPIATGAGGSGQQGSSSGSSTSSTSHAGAIAGGVVGGVAFLLLLLGLLICLLRRRRRAAKAEREKGDTDLLDAPPSSASGAAGQHGRWYQQEPFVPPTILPQAQSSRVTPSSANATEGPVSSGRRTGTDPSDPGSPTAPRQLPLPTGAAAPHQRDTSITAGDAALAAAAAAHDPKKRQGEQRRSVNWVQHADAGAVPQEPGIAEDGQGGTVTVDVPPSYETLLGRSEQGRV
ncbi:hypothetical protein CALVIDRAFT_600104 [Calocera viscosa TUFC12733]|uniref:Mid2 domain-containing protein n=1 Tax=Calocera viscosa (strain TUFC12733) TaxID=1330018 RepID=A0A167K1Z2_CALVF|nr:hypothetical protein CALVIDRAFT_600104 [Calocera viscosa TUFC12733]